MSNIAVCLAVLIGSAALPAPARAFSNTIQVTTAADSAVVDSQCSLREALTNANNNALTYPECLYGSGGLVITFAVALGTATITLTSPLPAITHTTGLTIDGSSRIAISGNSAYRVFIVNGGVTLTLSNLTVEYGKATPSCSSVDNGYGGGVLNDGTLTIKNSVFSNNNSVTMCGGFGALGGAVYNDSSLTISNSIFSGNSSDGPGGAVANSSGSASITNSSFIGNTANNLAHGGGGGAIYNYGTLAVANSTFGANSASGSNGGSMISSFGQATLTNNTFSSNSAISGGNIYNTSPSTLNLYNNILANSLSGGDCVNNLGTLSANNNLIESTGSSACGLVNAVSSNLIGFDPNLASIYASTYFPLFAGSLAIDAGDDAVCAAAPVNNTSQNGLTRPQGTHCDIGSYERDTVPPGVLSSVRANPDPSGAGSVNFTVTFSEPVTGVDSADFNLTTSGSVSGAAVTGAVGSGASASVTVNTGSGSGTIRLNVVDDDSIMDAALNPLGGTGSGNGTFSGGATYSIDKTAPGVVSILRAGADPTNRSVVDFNVNFSEAVTGVDAADFSLTTTGLTGASITGLTGSGTARTVTVNTGSGDGTIRLDLVDNDTITDPAANPLGGAGAGNGTFIAGQAYTVDKTLTINSIGAQDGWVLEGSETSTRGGSKNAAAATLNLGDDAARKQYRAILSFDTGTPLPDNAMITGVTLRVMKQGSVGGGSPMTILKGLLVDIQTGPFGAAALQPADFQAHAGQTYGPFSPTPSGNWYNIDLSDASGFINELSAGAGLTQIRLRFKQDDNNNSVANILKLYSGNAPAANRPQLIITYHVP